MLPYFEPNDVRAEVKSAEKLAKHANVLAPPFAATVTGARRLTGPSASRLSQEVVVAVLRLRYGTIQVPRR